MSYALASGVSGMTAFQQMIDVAGNNLANMNTTAFKGSSVNFAACMSQTLKQASGPTDSMGGTNATQVGSGVSVGSITANMTGGSIVGTNNNLDVAIDGEGYFVVSSGEETLYTRAGAFGVDEQGYLTDPSTGYRVQRIGTTGESDGFQVTGNTNIRIPYDVSLPASGTTEIMFSGNCSASAAGSNLAQTLVSNVTYTTDGGSDATAATQIDQLDQFSGGSAADGQLGAAQTGTITISGYNPDGSALSAGLSFTVGAGTTVGDLITHLNTNVLTGSTASFVDGQIVITDDATGYSRTDIAMTYSGAGSLETPAYFEMSAVGGEEVINTNITTYDSLGNAHVLSAALVRTDTPNTWDLVLTSVTGDVEGIAMADRRIAGITFDAETGAYAGITGGAAADFAVAFSFNPTDVQTISLNLGTVGAFDGLTQFAGDSTAVAQEQDGYESGSLTSVSVGSDGVIIGTFSNGEKRDVAALAIALFKNPSGLASVGDNYFTVSANSGEAVVTQAGSGGAGTIQGNALEESNVDMSAEFVKLIEAQNGFQANARTITVANDILQELVNLIR